MLLTIHRVQRKVCRRQAWLKVRMASHWAKPNVLETCCEDQCRSRGKDESHSYRGHPRVERKLPTFDQCQIWLERDR